MLRRIVDVEDHAHLRIETANAERREIRFGVEHETISSVSHRTIDEKERLHASVGVGPRVAQLGPALISVLHLERNGHAARGRAARGIEDVRRNRAHAGPSSLRNLKSVIFACSAAALRNSAAGSFSKRISSSASISSVDLRVAQTMKIKPNFSS